MVTTDVDMLSQAFFALREQGDKPEIGVHFRFDNVTFVLNILDSLAGDDRFIEIRKRRPAHRMLARIEEETKDAKQAAADARENFSKKYDEQEQAEQKAIEDKIAELKKPEEHGSPADGDPGRHDAAGPRTAAASQTRTASPREGTRDQQDRDETGVESRRGAVLRYKLWAVLLPPIFPLVVAIGVFVVRRVKEREGVAKSRLR